MTGAQLRAMMISEFCRWLRSRTNKEKRPFQEETITAYKVAARALDAWMTAAGLDEDFTACDTGVLTRRLMPAPPGVRRLGIAGATDTGAERARRALPARLLCACPARHRSRGDLSSRS